MNLYPRLGIEYKGGEPVTIFSVQYKDGNGGKVENTFRDAGAGMSFGPGEYQITFQHKLGTTADRDYRKAVHNREIGQIVVIFPDGSRDVVNGAFVDRSGKSELEGAAEETMEFHGKVETSGSFAP